MFSALFPLIVLMASMIFQAVYCHDFRPYLPLALGSACAFALGLLRGRPWKELAHETFQTVGSVAQATVLYLLIGPTISSWIASGTLPLLIIWGSNVIAPSVCLPLSFSLMSLAAIFMGSGISSLGTMGIALMSIGRAMGYPTWLFVGVLGCGAYWGNSVSPMSTVNALSLAITGGDMADYSRFVIPRLLPPFIVTLLIFAVAGVIYTPSQAGALVSFTSLEELFPPTLLSLLPPLLLVVLLAMKMPTLPVFFFSILSACSVGLLTGHVAVSQLPSLIVDGYRYTGGDALLRGILNRGGINSVSSIVITVTLAMTFGGSYEASGGMKQVLEFLTAKVHSLTGLRRMTALCGLLTTMATGSATMGTALTGTLFTPKLKELGLCDNERAVLLGSSVTAFSPVIPWSISGAALFTFLGVSLSDPGALLYIPVSICSFLTPLWAVIRRPSAK